MNLASFIDYTQLNASCTLSDVQRICAEAIEYQFAGVCIPPYFVKHAAQLLNGHRIKVVTVIGFPMGYSATPAKVEEIKRAINDGTDELDIVVNICAIKNKDWNYVRNDIDSNTRAVHLKGKVAKIIFETSLLEKEEILRLCEMCNEIGVNYVKTSTGFNGGGADVATVELLRKNLLETIKIKASGGIRTKVDAEKLIAAGAQRIGSSSGIAIVS